ncbi:hypothetical protein [Cohnella yongneupensis]|uniref:Outer membrane lipoprotein-sorting protein n=1 Tax=Cohnella yongneupensis TaxID=425006 RepID=A0ABW0R4C1_9BACL
MYTKLSIAAVLLLMLCSCGARITPEDTLEQAIAAHEQADHFQVHMNASQKTDMDAVSVKQTASTNVQIAKDKNQYYMDSNIKNPVTSIDTRLYIDGEDYYMQSDKLEMEWMLLDDPDIKSQLGGSLMMDYDNPSVYLNLLLDDVNRMTVKTKDGATRLVVTEPTEKTKLAIAQYLIDNAKTMEQGTDFDIEVQSVDMNDLEIVFDERTSLIRSISMDQVVKLKFGIPTAESKIKQTNMTISQTLTVTYDHYDDTEIELPDELTTFLAG